MEKQFAVDQTTKQAGSLSKDNTLRTLRRSLQNAIQYNSAAEGKYHTLADIGITSDAKTGALKLDETKAKQSLAENYVGVANMFVQSNRGPGFGTVISDAVRQSQSASGGVLASKDREYSRIIKNFDDDIERKERIADSKAESIKRRFAALEQLLGGLNAQGQYLQAKMAQQPG